MAAYFVVNVRITDQEGYEDYRRHTAATLEPFGGRFIVRGGKSEILEGEWELHRFVMIEFPSIEAAKGWYESPEYQRLKEIRQRTAHTDMILVEGV